MDANMNHSAAWFQDACGLAQNRGIVVDIGMD
jgi:hypothetical protein